MPHGSEIGPPAGAADVVQRRTAGLVVDGVVGPATAAALQLKVIPAD